MDYESVKVLAAALALLPMIGAAMGIAKIFSSYFEALGRNPSAAPEMNKFILVGAAFAEALGLFAWVIATLILFVI